MHRIPSSVYPEQTLIPGTEPPPEDPERTDELDQSVYSWLDAQDEQRGAGATTKIKHASMLTSLQEAGLERYPYRDRRSGKKRYVVVQKTPKAKTTSVKVAKAKKPKRSKPFADDGDKTPEQKADAKAKAELEAQTVESRRVSRESVKAEIDPFSNVRNLVDANKTEH